MSILETEVDGITTLFAQRPDGACSAGLVFRVGWADETLAVRGLTHLVEHLALHDVAAHDVHHNGETHATYTHFYAQGSPQQVVRVLNGVCAWLRERPTHRLEVEKDVLRAEEQGRGGAVRAAALYRYGARGYGLEGYPELGLPGIDETLVRVWAQEAFTRSNAVLWLAGAHVPDGLDLSLPEGVPQPLPAVTDALERTPAWFPGDADLVHVTGIVPRSTAAMAFAEVLNRAVFHDLRQREGLSYSPGASYVPRDADVATVSVVADCLPERRGATVGALLDSLARVRWGTITDEELDAVRTAAVTALEEQRSEPAFLARMAVSRLLGGPPPAGVDRLQEEYRALTAADLREVAETFHATALAQVPGRGLDWAGWHPAPTSSRSEVTGQEYPARGGVDATLVVGEDGVTLRSGPTRSTVRFRDVAVMESYGDGGRWLVGEDGFRVHVEPSVFEVDQAVTDRLDASVDPARVVHRPARSPQDLPGVPEEPGSSPAAVTRTPRTPQPVALRLVRAAGLVVLGLFSALWLLVTAQATMDAANGSPDVGWVGTGVLWVLMAALGSATYQLWRAGRR